MDTRRPNTAPYPLGMTDAEILAIPNLMDRYQQAGAEIEHRRSRMKDAGDVRRRAVADYYWDVVARRKAAGLPVRGARDQTANELGIRESYVTEAKKASEVDR